MAREDHTDDGVRQERDHLQVSLDLRDWYGRGLGQSLLESERRELDTILPDLFGYYLVQLGSTMEEDLLGSSLIRHRIVIDETWPADQSSAECGRTSGIYGHAGILPLQSDSVDVILLPHTLEFETVPHEVLREAERTLVPEGYLIIMGFNPWSLWGLWRLFTWYRRRHPPWHGTFRGIMRLKDWLALLGFDVVATRSCFFRPPFKRPGLMRRLSWMERMGGRWWPYLGATWIIVAKKRVVTLTPIKPRWRPRRSLIHGDAIKPTT